MNGIQNIHAEKVLYDIFLARMVEKGKKEIFLGSGNLEYKKKYGSIEESVYHCAVLRIAFIQLFYVTKRKLMSLIQGMYCIIVGGDNRR